MYEQYYHLREKPFSLLPDPDFLYLGEQHSMALHALRYGVMDQVGFVVVTGEIGCGKTTLVRKLLQEVKSDTTFGLISNTHGMQKDVLERVLLAFNIESAGSTETQLYRAFVNFLTERYSENQHTVLIVDEAQNLTAEALEELRLLSNVNADKDQLLQIILLGQPELRDTLLQPTLVQFAQRISAHVHLEPLDETEIIAFIRHRLKRAGGEPGLFTDEACHTVYRFAKGIPRVVNRLCDLALVYGHGTDKTIIEADLIETVSRAASGGGLGLLGGQSTNTSSGTSAHTQPSETTRTMKSDHSEILVRRDSRQLQQQSSETALPAIEERMTGTDRGANDAETAPNPNIVVGTTEPIADSAQRAAESVETDVHVGPTQPQTQEATGNPPPLKITGMPPERPARDERQESSNTVADLVQQPSAAEKFEPPEQSPVESPTAPRPSRQRDKTVAGVAGTVIVLVVGALFMHEKWDLQTLWNGIVTEPLLQVTASIRNRSVLQFPAAESDAVAESSDGQEQTSAPARPQEAGPGADLTATAEEHIGTSRSLASPKFSSHAQTSQAEAPEGPSAPTEIDRLLGIAAVQQRDGELTEALATVEAAMKIDQDHGDLRALRTKLIEKIEERGRERAKQEAVRRQIADITEAIQANLESGNLKDAEVQLEQGLVLDPQDGRLNALRAELERVTIEREEEERKRRLREMSQLVNKATQARNDGRLSDALALIERAIEIDPTLPGLSASRTVLINAIAERDQKRQAEASRQRQFEDTIARAQEQLDLGNLENAQDLINSGLTLGPEHALLKTLQRDLNEEIATRQRFVAERRRRAITEVITRIEQALEAGDLAGATVLLDQHLAENPQNQDFIDLGAKVEDLQSQRERRRAEQTQPPMANLRLTTEIRVKPIASDLEQDQEINVPKATEGQDEPTEATTLATEYMRLGERMLERGDVASARLFFQSAVEEGYSRAMLAIGSTYDPVTIRARGLFVHTNPVEAAKWYQRASRNGQDEADERLDALRHWFAKRKPVLETAEANALENILTQP